MLTLMLERRTCECFCVCAGFYSHSLADTWAGLDRLHYAYVSVFVFCAGFYSHSLADT